MKEYTIGSKGTLPLMISAVGNIIMIVIHAAELLFFCILAFAFMQNVPESRLATFYFTAYGFEGLGYKHMAALQIILLLILIIVSLLFAVMAFRHAYDGKRRAAFITAGSILSVLTIAVIVLSRNYLLILQLLCWILLLIGGILAGTPLEERMPYSRYRAFDPGLHRENDPLRQKQRQAGPGSRPQPPFTSNSPYTPNSPYTQNPPFTPNPQFRSAPPKPPQPSKPPQGPLPGQIKPLQNGRAEMNRPPQNLRYPEGYPEKKKIYRYVTPPHYTDVFPPAANGRAPGEVQAQANSGPYPNAAPNAPKAGGAPRAAGPMPPVKPSSPQPPQPTSFPYAAAMRPEAFTVPGPERPEDQGPSPAASPKPGMRPGRAAPDAGMRSPAPAAPRTAKRPMEHGKSPLKTGPLYQAGPPSSERQAEGRGECAPPTASGQTAGKTAPETAAEQEEAEK